MTGVRTLPPLMAAALLVIPFAAAAGPVGAPAPHATNPSGTPPADAVTKPGGDPGPVEEPPGGPDAGPVLLADALAGVPEDDPRMEEYSHGNYVLFVVRAVWAAALLALIVWSGLGARLQRFVEIWTHRANAKVAGFVVLYVTLYSLGMFPLDLHAFRRERRFGFATQTLPDWLLDEGKWLVVSIVLQVIFFVVLYGAIRRLDRGWWVAGAALGILFVILVVAIAPVFIAPWFNTFTPLKDEALRDEILALARAQGIPADEVYEVDASRQTEHNNAYVTGLLGTRRIVLYDTLLKNFSRREIRFVMGHEIGHDVLHHVWKTIGYLSILIVAGFLIVDRAARRVIARSRSCGIRSLAEPASLPLILLIFLLFNVATTPLVNSFSRAHEQRADRFALEVTGDPLAGASSFIKFGKQDLGEYHVHPAVETLLYSHPSLGRRIRHAQEYAAAHGISPRAEP